MRTRVAAAVVAVGLVAGWFGWQNGWLGTGRSSVAPSVLLISVDTLRADRLGSYGYKAASTPVLDGLARPSSTGVEAAL